MAFRDFTQQKQPIDLLQRSLERGRLGHAYLLTGSRLDDLEAIARTLAKTLNCLSPPRRSDQGTGLDCCDTCDVCRRIDGGTHPDVHLLRPESKLRQITVDQIRGLIHEVQLKPHEAAHKVGVVVAADRMNQQASNAFLKTLEEPPGKSVLLLLSTEPQRLLETTLSRCLRLAFGETLDAPRDAARLAWLKSFAGMVASDERDLLGRYRLLGLLLNELAGVRRQVEATLSARSPLKRYEDIEPDLQGKWEAELAAATEAEYRRQRSEVLGCVQWWLRDVWLEALEVAEPRPAFPELSDQSKAVASRISSFEAAENLSLIEGIQAVLNSNVQEALALEVGLLKLRF